MNLYLFAVLNGFMVLVLGLYSPPQIAGMSGIILTLGGAVYYGFRSGNGLRAGFTSSATTSLAMFAVGFTRHYPLGFFVAGLLLSVACGPLVGWFFDHFYFSNLKLCEAQAELVEKLACLRKAEEELAEMMNFLPFGILMVDSEDRIISWNRTLEKMAGVNFNELVNKSPATIALRLFGEAKPMLVELSRKRAMTAPEAIEKLHFENLNKDGYFLSAESYAPCLRGGKGGYLWEVAAPLYIHGEARGSLECLVDITDRRMSEERLKHLSTHDALTGLYNRTYLEEEVARMEKGRQFPVSVIMADVDGLKAVNDKLGHAAGDRLIKSAADFFRLQFRDEDLVARLGGDEFVVLLPTTDAEVVEKVLTRIRSVMKGNTTPIDGVPLVLSFGAATAIKGSMLRTAFVEADDRMYAEKFARTGALSGFRGKGQGIGIEKQSGQV